MTIWRMRIACWIPMATDTHREYVIHIASPLQQRLHGRATVLRYTHSACLVRMVLDLLPVRWRHVSVTWYQMHSVKVKKRVCVFMTHVLVFNESKYEYFTDIAY